MEQRSWLWVDILWVTLTLIPKCSMHVEPYVFQCITWKFPSPLEFLVCVHLHSDFTKFPQGHIRWSFRTTINDMSQFRISFQVEKMIMLETNWPNDIGIYSMYYQFNTTMPLEGNITSLNLNLKQQQQRLKPVPPNPGGHHCTPWN